MSRSGYNIQGHFGAVAQVLIGGMFGAAQPLLLRFPLDRGIFLREYATWIGAGFSVCVVFQLVLIVNLYNLQKAIKRKHKVGPSGGKVTSKDSGAQMHNPHIPPPVP